MPHVIDLKFGGLRTNPNALQLEALEGALGQADNVVIDRPDICEPRRGLPPSGVHVGSSAYSRPRNLMPFGANTLLSPNDDEHLYFTSDAGATWSDAGGYASPPSGATRVRGAIAKQAPFTTSRFGLQKLVAGYLSNAGLPEALTPTGSHTTSAGYDWLPNGSSVAYRVLITATDPLGNVLRCAPSGRLVYTNSSGVTGCVSLRVPIHPFINNASYRYFLEVYRSATATGTPSDDMGLLYRQEVFGGPYVTVTDINPDVLRGQSLYTNARQEGIGQAAAPPPVFTDIAAWQGCLWGANTTERQTLEGNLMGTGGTAGLSVGTRLVIGPVTMVAAAANAVAPTYTFNLVTSGSVSQNQADTVRNILAVLAEASQNCAAAWQVYGKGLATTDTDVGRFVLSQAFLGSEVFVLAANQRQSAFQPAIASTFVIAAGSAVRTSNVVTITTATGHGYASGDVIQLSTDSASSPFVCGPKTIAVTGANTFTFSDNGANYSTATGGEIYDVTRIRTVAGVTSPYASTADVKLNAVRFSKQDEVEAWPTENEFQAGAEDKKVLRLVATRDSLWVFKEDGLWRVSGQSPETFACVPFDPTLVLKAPDSAVALNNNVYAWTNQGVVSISEAGVDASIGFPIDDKFRAGLLAQGATNVAQYAFAVAYEDERAYLLWVPESLQGGGSSAYYPDVCYRFNYATRAWTRWTVPAACGCVGGDGKLYLGGGTADGLRQERKAGTAADYDDGAGSHSAGAGTTFTPVVQWLPQTAGDPGALKHWKGATLYLASAPDIPASTLALTFQVKTDWVPSLGGAGSLALANGETRTRYRFGFPLDYRRSSELTPRIYWGANGYALKLAGLKIDFNPGSEWVGR